MKKILVVSIMLLLLTGCNKKDEKNTTTHEVDKKNKLTDNIEITIDDTNLLDSLIKVNQNNFSAQLGLELEDVENYFAVVPYYFEPKIYIALKPASGKEEKVKKAMDLYLDNIRLRLGNGSSDIINMDLIDNCLKTEYNGYFIYIVDNNPELILEHIKVYLD